MAKIQRIFITGNPRKTELKQILKRFFDWITPVMKLHVEIDEILSDYVKADENYKLVKLEDIDEKTDLVLTFGGDGTILYTANVILEKEIPILGINLGGLGFLADVNIDQLSYAIEHVLHDDYQIELRNVLEISNSVNNLTRYAINDIIFDKAGYQRVIEIQVSTDNKYINNYIADGLILSTPTGSTGYNLSSNGPIIVPGTDVNIINPICPHSLTARPLIISANDEIRVKVNTESDSFRSNADGQIYGDFQSGTMFVIKKSKYPLKLVKLRAYDIFSILRNKLKWGEDFRNKNRWSFQS
jgi:NAD+ kinase